MSDNPQGLTAEEIERFEEIFTRESYWTEHEREWLDEKFPALVAAAKEVPAIEATLTAAGAYQLTGDDQTRAERIAGIADDALRLHREKCDALDALAAANARIAELEEALRPFAARAQFLDETDDDVTHWHPAVGAPVCAGDLRRAARLLPAPEHMERK